MFLLQNTLEFCQELIKILCSNFSFARPLCCHLSSKLCKKDYLNINELLQIKIIILPVYIGSVYICASNCVLRDQSISKKSLKKSQTFSLPDFWNLGDYKVLSRFWGDDMTSSKGNSWTLQNTVFCLSCYPSTSKRAWVFVDSRELTVLLVKNC